MSSRNNRILIIDDEQDICFLLSGMLKRKQYNVSYVNSLGDGFNYLSSTLDKPYLLFMDINLPDGSGLDFISTVKALSPETKIILISAYDTDVEKTVASQQGADLFVPKPFNKDIIYQALEKLVSPTAA
jgi:two-component system, OmpR family, response regulator